MTIRLPNTDRAFIDPRGCNGHFGIAAMNILLQVSVLIAH